MIVKNEMGRMWREDIPKFKILLLYVPGGDEDRI
jgi:hypothetical protein